MQLGVSTLPECSPVTAAPADQALGFSCLPGSVTTTPHLVRISTCCAAAARGAEGQHSCCPLHTEHACWSLACMLRLTLQLAMPAQGLSASSIGLQCSQQLRFTCLLSADPDAVMCRQSPGSSCRSTMRPAGT